MRQMKMGRLLLTLLLALSMVIAATACGGGDEPASDSEGAKEPEKITVRIGAGQTPEGYRWIGAMTKYMMPKVEEELAKTGNYEIEWVESWGGTVATVTESLEACQDGLLDVTNVCYVFEQSNLPYGNITYYVPFGVWDVDTALEIQLDFIDRYPQLTEEFEKFGQIPFGWATAESYNMTSKFPYTGLDSLDGKRVGAAGSNLSWVSPRATPIQSNGTEAYNALQTGLYEMSLQPTSFHKDLYLYEVAPYGLIGDFQCVWMGAITINTDFYNSLPEEVQKAFMAGGEAYTYGLAELSKEGYDETIQFLEENCEDVIYMTHEQKVEWADTLDNVPLTYVEKKEAEGIDDVRPLMRDYLTAIQNAGFEPVRDWLSGVPEK